jgi:hypothetical protein
VIFESGKLILASTPMACAGVASLRIDRRIAIRGVFVEIVLFSPREFC